MRNFREMKIWIKGIELANQVYRLVGQFPSSEEYGLKSQIRRAAVSIPSNIAEGSSRNSETEFKRYLEIALGSSFEVETDFIVASNLGMIEEKDLTQFFTNLSILQKQINALISKIKSNR